MIRSKAERILEIGMELGVEKYQNSLFSSFVIDIWEDDTILWLDRCVELWMEYNKIRDSMLDWEDWEQFFAVNRKSK